MPMREAKVRFGRWGHLQIPGRSQRLVPSGGVRSCWSVPDLECARAGEGLLPARIRLQLLVTSSTCSI